MNIVVCIKQVPDTNEVRIDKVTGTLIRDGVPSIMNPDDKVALEAALRLKDTNGATVTVVSMGPPQAQKVLREAYAMGADRSILITDRLFAGSDTLATSYVISSAIKKLTPDLIIAGRQAIDGDTAQVGPQIAEWLDYPHISYVQAVDLQSNGKTLRVERKFEDRYQVQEVDMPCLLTAIDDLAVPRYSTPCGIFRAYDSHDIEIWSNEDIGADTTKLGLKGSPTKVKASFAKATKPSGDVIRLDATGSAEAIVNKLKEHFIL